MRVPDLLDSLRLVHGEVDVTGTPRRLIIRVSDLAPRQQAQCTSVRGPPVKVAFDSSGKPTPALLGFCRKNNVPGWSKNLSLCG